MVCTIKILIFFKTSLLVLGLSGLDIGLMRNVTRLKTNGQYCNKDLDSQNKIGTTETICCFVGLGWDS